jgi:nitrous oxidase accessory protein
VQSAELNVSPGESLAAIIARANPGDHLLIEPGRHKGGLLLDRPLKLSGMPGAEIDGGGEGSVIVVDGPDVQIEGLRIVGSGTSHETIDSGVKLTENATNARVIGNHLEGNLYGVDIHGARDALVARNTIVGSLDARMNDRGNGVYVWNAPGSKVVGNTIQFGRDGIFVNASRNNSFRENHFKNLRFAVHYMYANDSEVIANHSQDNHLGYAIMFSTDVKVIDNVSVRDREYGVMLNYANESLVRGNRVYDSSEKCLFMYNANKNVIEGNHFERCQIGIHFTAGSERNAVTDNAFVANRVQVKYVGSRYHDWSGNFWSDHVASDINGDGIADQPFRPNDRLDQVLWTQPAARLLLGSPALQLVRWAQRAFPTLLPGGVTDTRPLMRPHTDPAMTEVI